MQKTSTTKVVDGRVHVVRTNRPQSVDGRVRWAASPNLAPLAAVEVVNDGFRAAAGGKDRPASINVG
jgi:hypothetical protein